MSWSAPARSRKWPIQGRLCWDDVDVSFYNIAVSTWTLATPRTNWKSNEDMSVVLKTFAEHTTFRVVTTMTKNIEYFTPIWVAMFLWQINDLRINASHELLLLFNIVFGERHFWLFGILLAAEHTLDTYLKYYGYTIVGLGRQNREKIRTAYVRKRVR